MTQQNQQQQPQQPGHQQPAQANVKSGDDSFLAGFKGTIGVIIALFVVFVLIPCGACTMCTGGTMCAGAFSDYQERAEEAEGGVQQDEGEGAEAERTVAAGERFELGDYAYTVDDIGTASALGPEISRTEPSGGAVFLLVEYRIENMTNETATALSGDFKLQDEEGREFRSSSEAETALAMMDETDFVISELQPGIEQEAIVAFEVPEESTEGPMTLVIPEKGMTSTDEVYLPFEFEEE